MKTIEERAKEYSAKQTYFVGDKNWYKLVEYIYEEAAKEQARIDTEFFEEIIEKNQQVCIEALKIAETDAITNGTEDKMENFVPDLTEETANELNDVLTKMIEQSKSQEPITMDYLQRHGFEKNDRKNGIVEFFKSLHIEKDPKKAGRQGCGCASSAFFG